MSLRLRRPAPTCVPCGPRRLEAVLAAGFRQAASVSGIMRTAPPTSDCGICLEPLFGRKTLPIPGREKRKSVTAGDDYEDNWQFEVVQGQRRKDGTVYAVNNSDDWAFRRNPEGKEPRDVGWGKTYLLDCGHEFHLVCIASSYAKVSSANRKCPTCAKHSSENESRDIEEKNAEQKANERVNAGLPPLPPPLPPPPRAETPMERVRRATQAQRGLPGEQRLRQHMDNLVWTFQQGSVTAITNAMSEFRREHQNEDMLLRNLLNAPERQESLLNAAIQSLALNEDRASFTQLDIVRQLLSLGAYVNGGPNPSPLAYAVHYQRPYIVDELMDNGADATVPAGFSDTSSENIVQYAQRLLREITAQEGGDSVRRRVADEIFSRVSASEEEM